MKILILGGGFGGTYTLKHLHKFFHNKKKVKLVLVNKKNYFIFTPLLHEVATGGVSIDNALEPIREIIKCCDFDFIHGEVEKIDLENKVVYINKERENYNVDYDYLVIALGSKTNYYNITGAKEFTFSLKTVDDAIRLKNRFVHMFELASVAQTCADYTQTNADNIKTQTDANYTQADAGNNVVQTNAENNENFLYEDLSYKIIGIAYKIKKNLGLGHKEKVYTNSLELELKKENIIYKREEKISVVYDGKIVGNYIPDFVIEDKIIVELKTLPLIDEKTKKQIWNYLKGTKYRLAILINFGKKDVEISRIIYDKARNSNSQQESASSQKVDNNESLQKSASSLQKSESNKYLTFVIVGGGATGVELAGEMSDLFYKTFSKLYSSDLISQVKIILIEKGKELIPQFSPKLRQKALERLKKLKVDIRLERGVIEVGEDFIKLDDGNVIETKTVIWAAGVETNLPEIIGKVEKDNKGRLVVNEYLQVKKKIDMLSQQESALSQQESAYDNVFAIGDVCCFIQDQKPLPQLAQVAVRQVKTVSLNIKNSIENKTLQKFAYKHTGDLISVGRFYALGEIKGVEFSGLISWFIWKGVYLSKIISFRDQIKTFIDWLLNLFLPRDITEL
ncbi:MAG: hypothetical protein KatS3mg094_069 [Candidatus Parcubacteria bacterium]|nr:MAG: hypothetical protein KatS3mg094_069 [Candidatus Parcubacteria bacterium]